MKNYFSILCRFLGNDVIMFIFKSKMQQLLKKGTLSVQLMFDFVHSHGNFIGKKGFKHLVMKEAGCSDINKIFPKTVQTSKSTVLRWMHACNAKYVRYTKGFVDRRNDTDVVLQLKEYLKQREALQKRQRLYTDQNGKPVLVDRLRSESKEVDGCQDAVYENLKTFYEITGDQAPKCQHHHSLSPRAGRSRN